MEGRGKGKEGISREKNRGGIEVRKMIFWNVAGIGNKGIDFWEYIKDFDFISLSETWLEEKGWNKLKGRLPCTHDWKCSFAERVKRKGRAKGGFLIGKKKGRERGIKKEEELGIIGSEGMFGIWSK